MGWGVFANLYFTMKVVVVPFFFSCREAIPGDAAAAATRPAVIEDDSHAMEGKYQSPSVVYVLHTVSPREKNGGGGANRTDRISLPGRRRL